jgi:hypothetical protein
MPIMWINVLLDNGVFKYSVGATTPPTLTSFVHHFNVNDHITWSYWRSNQRVQVTFDRDCPFAHADGTAWPGQTALFPGQAAKLHSGFDLNRKYSRIKYSVTLLDAPGSPTDDPEVIVVNG